MTDPTPTHPDEPDDAPANTGAPGRGDTPAPAPETTPPPVHATRRKPDPWAHRRGEPRVFAFLWTIYLLMAAMGVLMYASRPSGGSLGEYRPAARMLLTLVSLGVCVAWPLVRLSQARPRGSALHACALDTLVVGVPVQFVLWPLALLAGWPMDVVGALSAMMIVWAVLIGGLLATALAPARDAEPGTPPAGPSQLVRAEWMAAGVLHLVLAPILVWLYPETPGSAGAGQGWLPMLSPLTGVHAVTGTGFSGPPGPVSTPRWAALGGLALLAGGWWAAALLRARLAATPRTTHAPLPAPPPAPAPIPAPGTDQSRPEQEPGRSRGEPDPAGLAPDDRDPDATGSSPGR